MIEAEGNFLRQTSKSSWIARVTVQVEHAPSGPHILFDYYGHPLGHQEKPNVKPLLGYISWHEGIESGIRYALRIATEEQSSVRVIGVIGSDMDTNPTILGAAAMRAVWLALNYSPSPVEAERIEQIVLASWQHHYDHIPDFSVEA